MSVWSDTDILLGLQSGQIEIDPFDEGRLQPASVDLLLADEDPLEWSRGGLVGPADQRYAIVPWEDQADKMRPMRKVPSWPSHVEAWTLPPQGFALAATAERVGLDPSVVGRLEGKSSLARLGLFVHVTAGFFDPGFRGYPTLELFNATQHPMLLRPGMPIAQMSFLDVHTRAARPYGFATGSKYQDQAPGAAPSRYHANYAQPESDPS